MREPKVWLVIESGLGNLLVRKESATLPQDTYVAGPFRHFEAEHRREEEKKRELMATHCTTSKLKRHLNSANYYELRGRLIPVEEQSRI